jgi:hypothetical protein
MSSLPEETEFESLRKTINDLVIALAAQFDNKLAVFEKSLEQQEKQMAMLAQAVGEQIVLLEAFLLTLNFKTEEEQKQFHDAYSSVRNKMYNILKDEVYDDMAGSSSGSTSAAENLADTESSNPSE